MFSVQEAVTAIFNETLKLSVNTVLNYAQLVEVIGETGKFYSINLDDLVQKGLPIEESVHTYLAYC